MDKRWMYLLQIATVVLFAFSITRGWNNLSTMRFEAIFGVIMMTIWMIGFNQMVQLSDRWDKLCKELRRSSSKLIDTLYDELAKLMEDKKNGKPNKCVNRKKGKAK